MGSTGKRIRETEWDVIHAPIMRDGQRRLVIFGHGRGGSALDFVNTGIGSRELNNYGVPFIAQDQAGEYSYGNESAIASIDETWAWAQANLGVKSDKLLFYFGSMGNFPVWNWIRRNPGKTAAVVCGLPVVQFDYLHDTLGNPYATEIETAHGSWSAAQMIDPLAHVDEIATGLAGAPVQYWYPTNDPLQPVAQILEFADGLGVPESQRINMGAVGHTMAFVNRTTMARFLASHAL